jgi:hypothetical protein
MLNSAMEKNPTNLEKLSAHIDPSLSQFLVVGSPSNIAAALLFEHVIWAERRLSFVIFQRLRLKPALWFAVAVTSMFASLVGNPDEGLVQLLDQKVKNSAQSLVWIGVILFERIQADLRAILVSEDFAKLPKSLFYPLISFQPTEEEIRRINDLDEKYASVLNDLFSVMVPARDGR